MWRWSNFLNAFAETSRRVVRINMDETGIRLLQVPGQGLVTDVARRAKRSARGLKRPATKHQTRAMFTLATMICDDPEVQRVLPQVMIVGTGILTAHERQLVERSLPRNVYVWQADKCWMTSKLMVRLIRLLKTTIQREFPDINIVFTADAYKAHLTKEVWTAMATAGIFYCLIPARMTSVLQPCDVAVFSRLKKQLATDMQQREVSRASGTVTPQDVVQGVGVSLDSIVRAKPWRKTFEDVGLVGHQRNVSSTVLAKLSLQAPNLMPHTLPTLDQLKEVFPARMLIPVDNVFAGVRRMLTPGGNAQPPLEVPAEPAEPPLPAPWIARLRRTRARAARAAPPEEAPVPGPSTDVAPPDSQPDRDTPQRHRDPGLFPVARRLLPPRRSLPPAANDPRTAPS